MNKKMNDKLIEASGNGNLELVKELIAAGADVNTTTEYGGTSLIIATYNGHIEVVRELI